MINIRKLTTFILTFLIVFSLILPVVPAKAATMDSSVGAVTTGGGSLYVRSSPSTGSSVLAALKKGSFVTLLSKSGSWWRVEYANGKFGYCHANYITPVEGTPAKVQTDGDVLNVRSGPGTSHGRIATVPHGSIVLVRSEENGWSKILYHGTKIGFVSSKFLSGQHSGSTSQNYSAISLAVPSFKQTDKRWASTPLGTTGGTIGKIGCAVTGIAMMESYRTGTTIYPNTMASKLSFSAGGAVYWPSHFKVYNTGSGYLAQIYELLKEGKPVLLGSKTSAGRQHWVVITGFTGGNTLTTSGFTINDPGSSRTTLQQHLNSFPILYKFFSY